MDSKIVLLILQSVFKQLTKATLEHEVDWVYLSALEEWCENDNVRKNEYVHKFAHFRDLENML